MIQLHGCGNTTDLSFVTIINSRGRKNATVYGRQLDAFSTSIVKKTHGNLDFILNRSLTLGYSLLQCGRQVNKDHFENSTHELI